MLLDLLGPRFLLVFAENLYGLTRLRSTWRGPCPYCLTRVQYAARASALALSRGSDSNTPRMRQYGRTTLCPEWHNLEYGIRQVCR